MSNELKNISEIAATLKESEARFDIDSCKMAILFPFVEALGYDATQTGDILLNPAYTEDGEYKLDYGLRGEDEDSTKTVIKVIPYESEPGLEFANIRRALSTVPGIEYVMITDCFNYYVYANSNDETFVDVVSFDICEIKEDDVRMLKLLTNPSTSTRQDFAIDRFGDMDEDTEESPSEKYLLEPQKKQEQKQSASKPVLPILVGILCVMMIGVSILLAVIQRNDPQNWYSVSFPHNSQSLNVHALKGTVSVSAYTDRLNVIKVSISESNLPANVNITVTLNNTTQEKTHTQNILTDETGGFSADISIPSGWVNCNISAKAEVCFDANQTTSAIDYYGANGIKIIQLGEKDKFLIGTDEAYYNSTKIEQTIKENEEKAAAEKLQQIRQYFAQFTIVEYANGDICFYPMGYDTDDWPTSSDATNNNINANDKAYAKIYYDKSSNTATLYYVVGTLMSQASWASGSFLISDTVNTYSIPISNGNFYYHMNSYTSITGWCVFTENGVSNLRAMLNQIYSSSTATIEFKGLNQKVYISQKDKNAITSILDLYEQYFASGNIVLDRDWF